MHNTPWLTLINEGRVYLSSFGTLVSHRTWNSLKRIEMIAVTNKSDLTHIDHSEPGGVINLNAVVLCVFKITSFIWEFKSVLRLRVAANHRTMADLTTFGLKQSMCVCQCNMSGQTSISSIMLILRNTVRYKQHLRHAIVLTRPLVCKMSEACFHSNTFTKEVYGASVQEPKRIWAVEW